MTVTINAVAVAIATTATDPLIEGSPSSSYGVSQGGTGFSNASSATGRKGCRVALSATTDFTTHQFVSFQLATTNFGVASNLATIVNGGYRIVFVDSVGAYAGYNLFGNGIPNYSDNGSADPEGFFGSFTDIDSQASCSAWHIDRNATKAISSGSINWAAIVAVEITVNAVNAIQHELRIGKLLKHSGIQATGTETLISVNVGSLATASLRDRQLFRRAGYSLFAAAGVVYAPKTNFLIGNGSTTTNFTDSNFLVGFFNTYDKSPTYRSVGPFVQLDSSGARQLLINQSATDTLSLSDGSIASAAWWQWVLQGSGTATLSRVQFWRYNQFLAAHGTYTDCIWDGGEAAVEIGTSTTITRGTIRNCTNGIKILSAAGTYNQTIAFSNQTTYDIECGSGGAGTYNLPNISVVGSYTLKIRNNSATNAITVAIPAGIAFTTSTAGGSITVSTPPTYQSVTVNGLVSGSRLQIYDTTSLTELANVTTTTSYTWTDTIPASANRVIRVRIAYQSGVTAKLFIEANIGTCGTSGSNAAVTYLANQADDTVYIANGINGSTVTGITITDSIDRMVINIAGGSVSWPQIYAYNVYWLTTAAGIIDDGSIITAIDTANYRVSLFKIRNSSATPLNITGGYGVDATTGTVGPLIDTAGSTGNIYQTPDHVVAYQTSGTYAITGDISTVLTAVGNVPANVLSAATAAPISADVKRMNGTTVIGNGTAGNLWRG